MYLNRFSRSSSRVRLAGPSPHGKVFTLLTIEVEILAKLVTGPLPKLQALDLKKRVILLALIMKDTKPCKI